jgi:uncharacterized protein DUF4099/uncharacterized protein DUF3945
MLIQTEDLPLKQFEMLGVSKTDILGLPPQTLNALLSGQRTSLMHLPNVKVAGMENPVALDAKMSVELNSKNEPVLKIHPINKVAQNKFNLTDDEINLLKNKDGEMISKTIKTAEGSKDVLVTLDKTTNEYIAVNKKAVNAPEAINDIPLSEEQKTDFKNGKKIKIGSERYRLDPKSETGITSDNGESPSRLKFKHSEYSFNKLLLDVALVASGLGGIVLVEHIVDLALHSKNVPKNSTDDINNRLYWQAIADASKEIKKLKEDHKYTPALVTEIIAKHLEQAGINHSIDKTNMNSTRVDNKNNDGLSETQNNRQSINSGENKNRTGRKM